MQQEHLERVGVIGLGIIGNQVASLLRDSGRTVYVWNRSPKPEPNFLGSPAELAHVQQFEITETAADVDLSELASQFTDGDVGQITFAGTATVHRAEGAELLRTGKYDMIFEFAQAAATDGTLAGVFRILSISMPFQYNGSVAHQITFANCGTVTVTNPAAT